MSDVRLADSGRVVVVGAGHGGGTVATTLRQQGFGGDIVIIGAEPVGPYHRPPLSKSLLKGNLEQPLQAKTFYHEQDITLRTGTRVVSIDREARAAILLDGETVSYDILIIATGARARRLPIPGHDLEKVYELRTVTDARVLHDALTPGRHLAIVGGGWIGLEVASSARAAGVDVTVIEREERLLARVASREVSSFLTDYHRARGTEILTAAQVSALERGERHSVGAVALSDGRSIACDRVLIGIGAVADDELARMAGLRCEDGIVVDLHARTEDPYIYAVGDVTRRPLASHVGLFRLESIPSAVEQARQAVASILGKPAPMPEVPWFWSEQFDLKLHIAGLLIDTDRATVREDGGDKLAVFHTRHGRLIAVEAINASAEFMAGKTLIRDAVQLDLEKLSDSAVSLSEIAAAAPEMATVSVPTAPAAPEQPPAVGALSEPGGIPGRPRVTFIQPDGEVATVDVAEGLTLMDASVRNNLRGIIAECGGMCSCGTCHVYVEEPWEQRLPEADDEEQDLLEFIEDRRSNSRLSCQIVMDDELDGLVVRVAES
jgi:3-phenylpropionate/trans-cinnamate dioxygenase ferredoxin reductase subunit